MNYSQKDEDSQWGLKRKQGREVPPKLSEKNSKQTTNKVTHSDWRSWTITWLEWVPVRMRGEQPGAVATDNSREAEGWAGVLAGCWREPVRGKKD